MEEDDFEDDLEEPPRRRGDRLRAWGPLCAVLALFAGLGAAAMYAGYSYLSKATKSHAPDYATASCAANDAHKVLVEVEHGATGQAIGDALRDAGVVRSVQAFVDAALDDEKARDISAGTYRVCPRISAATAIAELLKESNLSADSVIEVKPGEYGWEAIRSLAFKRGWDLQEVQQVIDTNQIGLPAWAKGADGRWAVEGMLEPGRYTLTATDTPAGVLSAMVKTRVDDLASLHLEAKASALKCGPTEHCTAEQALIIASLAEAEVTRADPDGRRVSEAVQNRLSRGDYLGVDATTKYWLSMVAGKRVEVTKREVDDPTDPFATGAHKGLPPTPVSIPSKEMVAAVLAPTSDGWFYWCAGGGGTKFFKDSQKAEFEQTCLKH